MVSIGSKVFVPTVGREDKEPFVLATVLTSAPKLTVKLPDGSELSPDPSSISIANQNTEADNTALVNLSDATLLANTKERWVGSNIIYTSTGSIITSVNPCTPMPALYDEAAMAVQAAPEPAEPHIFGVADAAYVTLLEEGRNQSIIVSGISGAGKTEAIKYIMRYLCWRSAGGSDGDGGVTVAKLVVRSNPVFEAFGNATTVNNPNSSRFGKFIRMHFGQAAAWRLDARSGAPVSGARIETYLLEKSRLSAQQPNERNFHVFYQMLAGLDDPTLASLGLERTGRYRSLGGARVSPFSRIGGHASGGDGSASEEAAVRAELAEEFADVRAAMGELGLQIDPSLALLAALLHLGNLGFEAYVPDGEASESARVSTESTAALAHASRLLGMPGLEAALTKRTVKAGGGRRSMYDVHLSVESAAFTRDALAKKLYEGLFRRTVGGMNSALSPDRLGGAAAQAESSPTPRLRRGGSGVHATIGLLDVFGFEVFETNGFEQLMVNLANERLQRFFLDAIFRREQEQYADEELGWVPLADVPDNSRCIATIEEKPYGVLPLLDEQCRLGERGTDAAFCEMLNSKNTACVAAVGALDQRGKMRFRPSQTFTVGHFVQPVTYTAADFLERNRDTFFGDLSRALYSSDVPFVAQLMPASDVQTEDEVSARGTGRSYATVASGFVHDLAGLLSELAATDPGFVRCIKPNAALTPAVFDSYLVLHQLRTCGMVQAVTMMSKMFGARLKYTDILAGYLRGAADTDGTDAAGTGDAGTGAAGLIGGLPVAIAGTSPLDAVASLCFAFDVPICEYAFGKGKLFFRAGQAVGLAAFTKPPPSRADAIARAVVLRWKLGLSAKEARVGAAIASWLRRARTSAGKTEALLTRLEAALVATYTSAASDAAGAGTQTPSDDARAHDAPRPPVSYAVCLGRGYRTARRQYAVEQVQRRAAVRIAKHERMRSARKRFLTVTIPERDRRMATRMQSAARRRAHRVHYEYCRGAAVQIQKGMRGRAGRRRYEDARNEWLGRATPGAMAIQARWRATAPARTLRAQRAAAKVIQSTYRMVRIRRLHSRLLAAAEFLKKGGVLAKYKMSPSALNSQERHERFVKVSADLTRLIWSEPSVHGQSSKEGVKEKSLPLDSVSAVTQGAKTSLMKKMYDKATGSSFLQSAVPGMKPLELELSCAFSIIAKERTLDFVAQTPQLRDVWLANLQMLLVNRATHETSKVMGRVDVVEELRTMSMAIGKLRKQATAARFELAKAMSAVLEASHSSAERSLRLGSIDEGPTLS